jgi:hypothetical protein
MSEQIELRGPGNGGRADPVQTLRDARGATSVHKLDLATLRAYNPRSVVFVCEGVDDKKVYFHWLKELHFFKNYEFLVCNGKEKVLQFRESLQRDLSGLKEGVYFIVDKDFDELRGYPPGADIYMTETYSFENFLVCSEVLNRILTIEMHCHAAPATRNEIVVKFHQLYESFLALTRPHNLRIFLARRLGIMTRPLPNKINKLASVSLLRVEPAEDEAKDVITLSREPEPEEINQHEGVFNQFDAKSEYRGKFAVLFFCRWLELLAKDRNSDSPVLFKSAPTSSATAHGQLTIDSLASKSSVPATFRDFVANITNGYSNSLNEATVA